MFAGSLTQISLAEVLRLLAMSSQTGALILERRHFSASIFLQVGQIVHAACGSLEGLDALTEICEHGDASFAFSEGFIAPSRSLADYPNDKLIEKIKKRVDELAALRSSILQPLDIPTYLPGRKVQGLVAKPDELSLLLLADGKRAVNEIAQMAVRDLGEVCSILGRFRQAGVVEVAAQAAAPAEPAVPEAPEAQPSGGDETSGGDQEEKPARYWRGKRIG
jgi:hypothetical protein